MKKPPDKYKCIKLPITSILNNNDESKKIFNNIQDADTRKLTFELIICSRYQ